MKKLFLLIGVIAIFMLTGCSDKKYYITNPIISDSTVVQDTCGRDHGKKPPKQGNNGKHKSHNKS